MIDSVAFLVCFLANLLLDISTISIISVLSIIFKQSESSAAHIVSSFVSTLASSRVPRPICLDMLNLLSL